MNYRVPVGQQAVSHRLSILYMHICTIQLQMYAKYRQCLRFTKKKTKGIVLSKSSVGATYNYMLNMNKGDLSIGFKHELRNIHKS